MLNSYPIKLNQVHVSLLSFGDNVLNQINFRNGDDIVKVKSALQTLPRFNGNRKLDTFLTYVDSVAFTNAEGHRANAGKVLVLFTTGKPFGRVNDIASLANAMHTKGVKVVVVALNLADTDRKTFELISGDSKNLVPVGKTSDLPDTFGTVEKAVSDAIG